MFRKAVVIIALLLSLSCATVCVACLWDTDTLQMERLRFPGVLEIITGKFVRHSKAYYEWRIIDRTKKLEASPGDPTLIDDLAVAYAKLGRPEEGIPLLVKALEQHPRRYQTLSNLGTLLFFAGRLDESKAMIARALEINPDAHFGREKYQLLLTEYVQQSKTESLGVMSDAKRFPVEGDSGFARYVLERKQLSPKPFTDRSPEQLAELRAATNGVLGMMHFADYQSPILLEALGDLLVDGQLEENASQLAARAFLQAAKATSDPETAERFKKMCDEALATSKGHQEDEQGRMRFGLEMRLDRELADATAWFTRIEADENQWIGQGRDVDQAFAEKYYDSLDKTIAAAERQVRSEPLDRQLTQDQQMFRLVAGGAALCIGVPFTAFIVAIVVYYRVRKRRFPFSGSERSKVISV